VTFAALRVTLDSCPHLLEWRGERKGLAWRDSGSHAREGRVAIDTQILRSRRGGGQSCPCGDGRRLRVGDATHRRSSPAVAHQSNNGRRGRGTVGFGYARLAQPLTAAQPGRSTSHATGDEPSDFHQPGRRCRHATDCETYREAIGHAHCAAMAAGNAHAVAAVAAGNAHAITDALTRTPWLAGIPSITA
jgi:hypothetical protein